MKGAESDFDRAIALDPGYFLSYAYRGGIREEAGKDELALDDYRKVIELYPDYWYAFESAGAACLPARPLGRVRGRFQARLRGFPRPLRVRDRLRPRAVAFREAQGRRGLRRLRSAAA